MCLYKVITKYHRSTIPYEKNIYVNVTWVIVSVDTGTTESSTISQKRDTWGNPQLPVFRVWSFPFSSPTDHAAKISAFGGNEHLGVPIVRIVRHPEFPSLEGRSHGPTLDCKSRPFGGYFIMKRLAFPHSTALI